MLRALTLLLREVADEVTLGAESVLKLPRSEHLGGRSLLPNQQFLLDHPENLTGDFASILSVTDFGWKIQMIKFSTV